MNHYFEISDAALHLYDGQKYWVQYTPELLGWDHAWARYVHKKGRMSLTQHSDRVWEESNDVVRFLKNRMDLLQTEVDMKEFMWVKLSAKISRETQW